MYCLLFYWNIHNSPEKHVIDVVLVSLLVTLMNKFHNLHWCFHCQIELVNADWESVVFVRLWVCIWWQAFINSLIKGCTEAAVDSWSIQKLFWKFSPNYVETPDIEFCLSCTYRPKCEALLKTGLHCRCFTQLFYGTPSHGYF